jgi:hypothetical protein
MTRKDKDNPKRKIERVRIGAPPPVDPKRGSVTVATAEPVKKRNRIPQEFTEAIHLAAVMHGDDGKGKNGLPGYFYWLAQNDPRAYAHLVSRILPQKVQMDVDPRSALSQVLESVRAKLAFERSRTINGTLAGSK